MTNTMWVSVLCILLSVFVSSVSQVMLKKATLKTYGSVVKEYLNPLVVVAYLLFFGTTLLTLLAYRGIPLSLGPVLETTAYIYITLFGIFIFKEKISIKKLVALALIIGGILLYAFG